MLDDEVFRNSSLAKFLFKPKTRAKPKTVKRGNLSKLCIRIPIIVSSLYKDSSTHNYSWIVESLARMFFTRPDLTQC